MHKHLILFVGVLSLLLVGCNDYDQFDGNAADLKPASNYFDFNTRGNYLLDIDYELTGSRALVEVYDEMPIDTTNTLGALRADATAVFKAYTDESGNYCGMVHLPSALDSVYVYTSHPSCPTLRRVAIENGNIVLHQQTAARTTRAYAFSEEQPPYVIDKEKKFYSIKNGDTMGSSCQLRQIQMVARKPSMPLCSD